VFDLFRAEWRKITGNRLATVFLMLVFPVGAAAVLTLTLVLTLLSAHVRESVAASPPAWTDEFMFAWQIVNSGIGRLLVLAFAAIVFAGEYQWATWKNIIPRRGRTSLILVKFVAVAVFVVVSFTAMSLITGIGTGIVVAVSGGQYGPPLTGDVFRTFAQSYLLQAATAFTSALIASGYTALAAILTRSIIGSTVVGLVITFAELVILAALALLSVLLDIPSLTNGYLLTPGYNLSNISQWGSEGVGYSLQMLAGPIGPLSVTASFAIIAAWVVGLIALTALAFRRQDITA
jgi:hypothetical protein